MMKAYGFLELVSNYPYGLRIVKSDNGEAHRKRFSKTTARYEKQIGFIAEKLASLGVVDLERLATALKKPGTSQKDRIEEIVRLKPHISPDSGRQSMKLMRLLLKYMRMNWLRPDPRIRL